MVFDYTGYSSDRWQFITAASVAAASSVVLYHNPMARNIALMLGTMVSNPGGMQEAAREWAEVVSGADGVDFVKQTILDIKNELLDPESGFWKATSADFYGQMVDDLLDVMDTMKTYFSSVSDGMGGISTVYHFAAELSVLVSAVMMDCAIFFIASHANPIVRATSPSIINSVLVKLGQVVRDMMTKKAKSLKGLLLIVVGISFSLAMMRQFIDKNSPKPDFAPTVLEYVPPTEKDGPGAIQAENGGMPSMPTGSGGLGSFLV
ncbi:hypothetical protein GCM10022224_101400 [Nonomuraea antimicrobica]|uniref:Uncharacterized protein n=1 Tax=Nonomuraea antimicrobica TaxID=561173 RepID=A0ABP7EIA3_9ACTN